MSRHPSSGRYDRRQSCSGIPSHRSELSLGSRTLVDDDELDYDELSQRDRSTSRIPPGRHSGQMIPPQGAQDRQSGRHPGQYPTYPYSPHSRPRPDSCSQELLDRHSFPYANFSGMGPSRSVRPLPRGPGRLSTRDGVGLPTSEQLA